MSIAKKTLSTGISPFGQFGIFIAFLGIGFMLAGAVTIAAPMLVLHASPFELEKVLSDPKNIQVTRFVQFASTFFLFALPAYALAAVVYREPVQYLGFTGHSNFRQFYIILLLVIAALFAQSILSQINEKIPIPANWALKFKLMEDKYAKEILTMAQMKSFSDYLYGLLILAFLPALFEEMFFRGAMQQTFVRLFNNVSAGIIITSILFSAAHLSYYGFLTRFFLGLLLGYIFYYGKNIWLNIMAHFLNNAVVVTSLYMLSRSGKLTEKSLDDDSYPVYIGFIAIVAVVALFVFFKRESIRTLLVTNNDTSNEYQLPNQTINDNT